MTSGPDRGVRRPRAGVHRAGPLRTGLIIASSGVLVLLIAAALWWHDTPAPNVGVAAVDHLATTAATRAGSSAAASGGSSGVTSGGPSTTAGAAPNSTITGGSVPPSVPIQSGALPTTSAAAVEPTQLHIAKLGVTADVVPSGVDGTGEFAVPADVGLVGWYEFGPDLMATTGSLVIGGHVDSAKQGLGAFFRLRLLDPGDTFTITGSDGRTRFYRVVAREEYPKTTIRLSRYFTWSGAPRVTLMTCGGSFDTTKHSYRDNIAVTAIETS